MALKKLQDVITNVGTTASFPDCYIKVDSIAGGKELLEAEIGYYTKPDGIRFKGEKAQFVPNLSGDNFFKQAYDHVKAFPQFADATDC
jgi:hypothetical protein